MERTCPQCLRPRITEQAAALHASCGDHGGADTSCADRSCYKICWTGPHQACSAQDPYATRTSDPPQATIRAWTHRNPDSAGDALAIIDLPDGWFVMAADPAATCPSLTAADLRRARDEPVRYRYMTNPTKHLHAVNAALHNPTLGMASPIAAAGALFITPDRALHVARAGDIDVWVRQGSTWTAVFGSRFTPEGERFYRDHVQPETGRAARWDAHLELFARQHWCRSDMVGLRADISVEEVWARNVDEVVIATDGAELSAHALSDLDTHLRGLRVRTPGAGHKHPSGDIAVASISPATPPAHAGTGPVR